MRPQPWSPQEIPTIWVDYTTGYGRTGAGAEVKPRIAGGRVKPNLLDMLETAAHLGAGRIMFTGKLPEGEPGKAHWLMASTKGWDAMNVFPRGNAATFIRQTTQQKVEVRTAAEWFGDLHLSPEQARQSWDMVATTLRSVEERATMFLSPSATGRNLWALSLPKSVDLQPVSADIAEEIHKTTGQHHLEHLVAGENFSQSPMCRPLIDPKTTPNIDKFAYVDGRFMYASLCRELGIGPGRRLNRAAAFDLLENDRYARARYLVRFTVPQDWEHVGIFALQHTNAADGWYYPNIPGTGGDTWVDAAEIDIARRHGWTVEPLEAVQFQKARPLDTFAERIIRARDRVDSNPELPALLRKAVSAALRAMVIQAIGAFASRGLDRTIRVSSAREIPVEYQSSVVRYGSEFTYTIPGQISERNRPFYHPELATQIWARGRAKVLETPLAGSYGNARGGALSVNPKTLIGINGDAIYTTEVPRWALPERFGGGDDGKTGRLRLQGVVEGNMITPASLRARDSLKKRAEKAGPDSAFEMEMAS